MAEWGLLGSDVAAELALRSADAWMEYAHTADYRFHRFYNFPDPDNPDAAWQGSEREPDASGAYAYYMLLLHELTNEERYLDESKAAVEALAGNGFLLAYETHITAQAAAACARLWQITGDDTISISPTARSPTWCVLRGSGRWITVLLPGPRHSGDSTRRNGQASSRQRSNTRPGSIWTSTSESRTERLSLLSRNWSPSFSSTPSPPSPTPCHHWRRKVLVTENPAAYPTVCREPIGPLHPD